MEVIKAVDERNGKLVSTFACGEWLKEYAQGVETKPDVGYLFAYSSRNLKEARRDMGGSKPTQYWLAEAEVVGKVWHCEIDMVEYHWRDFWKHLKLRLRNKGAQYLLCSSITLVRRLEIRG